MAAVPLPPWVLLKSLLFLLLLPLLSLADTQPPSESESAALLRLKDSLVDPFPLSSWNSNSTPCDSGKPWAGIVCFHGIVTGLRLGGMGLTGKVDVQGLSNLHGLRTVSFVDNNFTGPIPDLSRLQALKAIYLSGNNFSGDIKDDFFSTTTHLKKLWLSRNSFSGEIPTSITKLSHLMELHLEGNMFTGRIPDINLPALYSFDVSNNKLEGPIPSGLEKFNASSFGGNEGLCGPKLGGKPCADHISPSEPTKDPTPSPPVNDHAPSSPSKDVQSGKTALVGLVLVILIGALVAGIAVARKKRGQTEFDSLGREVEIEEVPAEVHVSSDSNSRRHGSSKKSSVSSKGSGGGGAPAVAELVIVNEGKGVFALPDLMKAAAEVLGNGGLGSAYKAVMANGLTVVVKRLRDMNRVGKDGFESEMRKLGRLRHPNVSSPLAYYYRKEEKLLVMEFVEKGSLSYLLHGNRGPTHAALDWPTRLKIVRGIARGMAYIHTELADSDVPHGNLKSSNVLVGPDFESLLADFGFVPLVNPAQAPQSMFAYKSPESIQYRRVSPKSDVYCMGVVIIETLTGKFPSQYLNNGKGGNDVIQWVTSAIAEKREAELLDPAILGSKGALGSMERLLRVGAACTEQNPENRLDVVEALRRIEEIASESGAEEPTAGADSGVIAVPSFVDGGDELQRNFHKPLVQELVVGPELTTRHSGREAAAGDRSARRGEDSLGIGIS